MRRQGVERVVVVFMVLVLSGWVCRADPVPPPRVDGGQWSLVVIPDPQSYTQNYGTEEAPSFLYDGRFDKQTEWIVANRATFNIRFVSDVGDNVQNSGWPMAMGEWERAVRALNILHVDRDPNKPAVVPYAVAIGNHDYGTSQPGDPSSTVFEKKLGPGRFRDAQGNVKEALRDWFKGDDLGWSYVVDGKEVARGSGRNSWQVFSAGGREYLHLCLECAVTDAAIAWAKTVLAAHRGKPTIVTTHAFLDGGKSGKLIGEARRMGRESAGPNRTNSAPEVYDKLMKDEDQVFLVISGHMWLQQHLVLKNAQGHDVHALEQCYHLDYDGGRVSDRQKPAGGWPSGYAGGSDGVRNGSCWMTLLVFDEAGKTITRWTYSPLLGVWATDRQSDDRTKADGQDGVFWNRTFPVGDDVIEVIPFDFEARFGRAPQQAR